MYCDLVDFDNKIIGHFKEKNLILIIILLQILKKKLLYFIYIGYSGGRGVNSRVPPLYETLLVVGFKYRNIFLRLSFKFYKKVFFF